MPDWPANWAGDVLLADGGTAHVRPIAPQDDRLLAAFHARLSPESIYLRFFSPHPRLSVGEIEHFTHVDHDARVALVVLLGDELIGVGRYDRLLRSDTAEVAFVVGDAQQGRGIATLLLERLAAVARERGLHRFAADVLPHNRAMLRVFHDAGFEVTSRFEDGVVRLSFPIDRTPEASAVAYEREWVAQARSIERLLAPRGIGVIAEGAAAELVTEVLLRQLADGGFAGPVRRLSAHAPAGAGAGLDLIFVAVPPELLRAQIERCAGWGVYGAVLLVSGGPEDEAATARGDRALAVHARGAGLRLLGPASLGLARPLEGSRLEAVAAPVQLRAGGLALFTESSRRGREALAAVASRGLGISTFFSAGRKADVSASDALQFWEGDPATRVIGLSLRSLGNPRRSAAIARRVSRSKPVLVWLTDLLAPPSEELVLALDAHTGMIRCASLDDLLDVAEALLAPVEAELRDFIAARITAWERWRRSLPGRIEAPEGVDRFEARRRIDAILAERPEGTVLEAEDVAALLRCYGVKAAEPATTKGSSPRLRVVQDPAWGSLVALDARPGESVARLLPLTDRDVRALVARGPRALHAERVDIIHRIATLAADVPELASLALALPARVGERPALLSGSARVAAWTLGLAL